MGVISTCLYACRRIFLMLMLVFIKSWFLMRGILILGYPHGDRSTDHQCLFGVPLPACPSGGAGTAQWPCSGEKPGCWDRGIAWGRPGMSQGSSRHVTCCSSRMRFWGVCESDNCVFVFLRMCWKATCIFGFISWNDIIAITSSPVAHLRWYGECKSG